MAADDAEIIVIFEPPPPPIVVVFEDVPSPIDVVFEGDPDPIDVEFSDVGQPGPKGDKGDPAEPIILTQPVPLGSWVFPNPLGRKAQVSVYINDEEWDTDVQVTNTQVSVTFLTPQQGILVLI